MSSGIISSGKKSGGKDTEWELIRSWGNVVEKILLGNLSVGKLLSGIMSCNSIDLQTQMFTGTNPEMLINIFLGLQFLHGWEHLGLQFLHGWNIWAAFNDLL